MVIFTAGRGCTVITACWPVRFFLYWQSWTSQILCLCIFWLTMHCITCIMFCAVDKNIQIWGSFFFFFFLQNTFHTSFRVVFPFQFSIKWCGRNNNTCTILINIKSDVESQNCGDKTDKLKSIIFLIAPIVSTQTLF